MDVDSNKRLLPHWEVFKDGVARTIISLMAQKKPRQRDQNSSQVNNEALSVNDVEFVASIEKVPPLTSERRRLQIQ